MSLADEVRTVRKRVAIRLRELEPLVREYEELRLLASELGMEVGEGAEDVETGDDGEAARPEPVQDRTSSPRPTRSGSRRRRSNNDPAPDPQRDARLLAALRAHPGATTAELATTLGVPATSLYRPVRDLTTSGAIVKRGRGLYLAEP